MVMADYNINKKRFRDDESSELDIPEVKKIREDLLLGILDEPCFDAENQDLDSVMKSFEEELSASSASRGVVVVGLSSESGESQPELGYLLEASDDELGLPPSSKRDDEGEKNEPTELIRVDSSDSAEIGGFWGFDEHIPSFDSFELGTGEIYNNNNNNTDDYAAFDDGLFEYSSVSFDYSDYSWRLETMPAE